MFPGLRGGCASEQMAMVLRSTLFLACLWGALCYVDLDPTPIARVDLGPSPASSGNSVTDTYIRWKSEFRFSGAMKVTWPTRDLDGCRELCAELTGCMSYTRINGKAHFWRAGTCFMYDGVGVAQKTKLADSGVIPPRVRFPKQCHPIKGIAFMGPELSNGNHLVVQSVEECCLRCQEKRGCKVYTFLETDGTCWLKTRAERVIVSKEPCFTGIIDEACGVMSPFKKRPQHCPGLDIQWDFVTDGLLAQRTDFIWRAFKTPAAALRMAFGQYAYSVTGKDMVTLTLASGKNFVISSVSTNEEKMFHIMKIERHSKGIIESKNGDVDLSGSQLFFQLEIQPNSHAKLYCGFKAVLAAEDDKEVVLGALHGFFKLMVENIKLRFRNGNCPRDFLKREPLGSCNNPQNPKFGATNSPLRRLGQNDPSYKDGKSQPSGPADISPRLISNTVADQGTDEDNGTNRMRLTDAMITFGQFLAHDFVRSAEGTFVPENAKRPFFAVSFEKFTESLPIEVPADDKHFAGKDHLEFHRGVWIRENNIDQIPREHRNMETSYLDLSMVYGSNTVRADALRSFEKGKMKTNEDGFLPFNGHVSGGVGVLLDNFPLSTDSYVAGDVRCNVSPNLAAMHALWMKEHNKVADELDQAFGGSLNDDELYKFAKAITIAEYQSITYTEYLKLILGDDALDPYEWRYDPKVDASADAFFAAVTHRFGHSMIGNFAWKVAKGQATPVTQPTESFMMRDLFFNHVRIDEASFGDWIRGLGWHEARELDIKVVNELRNFLFTEDHNTPSADLLSVNIQRARDFGLPMYNAAREAHGLKKVQSFEEVACDKNLAQKLRELYTSVDAIDPFIGGLAECASSPDHLLGDLFHTSMRSNFKRFRDGDRLFYKGLQFGDEFFEKYPRLLDVLSDRVKLKDIAIRNTDSTEADFAGRLSLMQL